MTELEMNADNEGGKVATGTNGQMDDERETKRPQKCKRGGEDKWKGRVDRWATKSDKWNEKMRRQIYHKSEQMGDQGGQKWTNGQKKGDKSGQMSDKGGQKWANERQWGTDGRQRGYMDNKRGRKCHKNGQMGTCKRPKTAKMTIGEKMKVQF